MGPSRTRSYFAHLQQRDITVRMEVFWALKDVSLNDESDVMMLDQGDLTMCVVNNIAKK